MRFHDSMISLVGNTPLLRLNSVTAGIQATVLAKVEYFNPGGSVKDRIALRMIEAAEKSGALQAGGTIVEPTSGNTGVGLAIVAQQKGYKCIFVCPDKVSTDKINVMRAYGADVVVCPTAVDPEHPDSYYNVSDRLVRETPGAWKPDQYSQPRQPALPLSLHRPRAVGADRWADHPLRGRRGHRRDHFRDRALSEGRQ
ncbi:cysteine synthase [Streptomyces turgidiscabies]|uniref:Cysteine synthase n=1 Tax=Streptomyces turgidiscabies TaxID=85558 RepID=A0ABU0RSK2_9ACTN|nr:cysteine synthase [Streptomyces turgidiscabies]